MTFRRKFQHQDSAYFLCIQYTHDLQFLTDVLRQFGELRIQIIFFFVGTRSAQNDCLVCFFHDVVPFFFLFHAMFKNASGILTVDTNKLPAAK